MILQIAVPGGAWTWGVLFWATLFPLPIALAIFWLARRRDDDHPLAWAASTFVAGLGNGGLGAVAVGLLYFHVRE